jgi:cytochrome c oxidase subunit 2
MKLINLMFKARLALGIIAAMVLPLLSAASQQTQNAKRIEIVAKRFEFTPSEVTLKKGEPVVLVFQSYDVAHSIVVKELSLSADIHKGHSTELHIVPQTPGTFIGKCGHFCGSGHGRMQLLIRVTD